MNFVWPKKTLQGWRQSYKGNRNLIQMDLMVRSLSINIEKAIYYVKFSYLHRFTFICVNKCYYNWTFLRSSPGAVNFIVIIFRVKGGTCPEHFAERSSTEKRCAWEKKIWLSTRVKTTQVANPKSTRISAKEP